MSDAARFLDLARRLGPAVRARQSRAFGGAAAKPRAPSIVKSISVQHGRGGARATLRYVARLRESDRQAGDAEPDLFDEWGEPVPRGRLLEALDSWTLIDESEAESDLARAVRTASEDGEWRARLLAWRNFSKNDRSARRAASRSLARDAGLRVGGERASALLDRAAKLALRQVRAEDLAPARRYGRVATRHLAVSLPLSDERQAGLFEIAVAAFVREVFAAEGRPVLWAVHREHGKEVHAHLLVRNANSEGRAMQFDRDGAELDRLREALARHARGVGLPVEATRHGDRPELVRAVVDGTADLPRSQGRHDRAQGRGVARLKEVAPSWLATHGAEYAERLLARAVGESDLAIGRDLRSLVPAGYEEIAEHLAEQRVFGDAADGLEAARLATARFAGLREEEILRTGRDGLARWYLEHSPLLFGPAQRGRRADGATLSALYRRLPAVRHVDELPPVRAEQLARVVRALTVIHDVRGKSRRRVVDITRVARQREQLARQLEGFGGADDLRAAVDLRSSAAALLAARKEAQQRTIVPLRDMVVRDLRERGGRGS
jgi:hypothetical protein